MAGPHAESNAAQDPRWGRTMLHYLFEFELGRWREIDKVHPMDTALTPPRYSLVYENRTWMGRNVNNNLIRLIFREHLLRVQLTPLEGDIEEDRISFEEGKVEQGSK